MAIARIKFLDRKKILQEHVAIHLLRSTAVKQFSAALKLGSYDFPTTAQVIIEAKTLMKTLRFTVGNVRHEIEVKDQDVSALEADRILFRVIVLDQKTARKYGTADLIRPIENQPAHGAYSILPVELADDLGGKIWEVEYDGSDEDGKSDAPVLRVDRKAASNNAAGFVADPQVRALIMPAIFQQVLERILLPDEHMFDDSGHGWRDAWLRLGVKYFGEAPPNPEVASNDEVHDWIRGATRGLASRCGLYPAYLESVKP